MGVLDRLVQTGNSVVEVGRIKTYKGNSVYKVIVAGEEKTAYSALSDGKMEEGVRVILNRSESGKRFIVGRAGVTSQQAIKEIFRDG